jgi:hypothetical protein
LRTERLWCKHPIHSRHLKLDEQSFVRSASGVKKPGKDVSTRQKLGRIARNGRIAREYLSP